MIAIFKRELKAFFNSPIGYVSVAVIMVLFGYYYFMVLRLSSSYYIPQVFNAMFMWNMLVIPLLTMRSFTDEKRNRTDQALLTAPVSVTAIVWGKFLAAFAVFAVAVLLGGLLPAVIIGFFSSPNWLLIVVNFLGSLLYGAAMISIGVFLSCLTESQVVAAVASFGVAFLLMLIDQLKSAVDADFIKTLVGWISFNQRYGEFSAGLLNVASILFFLSIAAVFTFLTARKLESRRWS